MPIWRSGIYIGYSCLTLLVQLSAAATPGFSFLCMNSTMVRRAIGPNRL